MRDALKIHHPNAAYVLSTHGLDETMQTLLFIHGHACKTCDNILEDESVTSTLLPKHLLFMAQQESAIIASVSWY
jgi:hypothetical protein